MKNTMVFLPEAMACFSSTVLDGAEVFPGFPWHPVEKNKTANREIITAVFPIIQSPCQVVARLSIYYQIGSWKVKKRVQRSGALLKEGLLSFLHERVAANMLNLTHVPNH
jgi:hypothetical protein